jgi:hypothetical protein
MNAQDVKNEEEMLKIYRKFVLVDTDYQGKASELQEKMMTPWTTYEMIGKPSMSAQGDKIFFEQRIQLEGNICISANYTFFSSREDAMKAANYSASNTAEVASAWWFGPKESMGLTLCDSAYNYGGRLYPRTLLFNCNNICVWISVSLDRDKKANEETRLVSDCAKRVIERINKLNEQTKKGKE